MSAPPCQRWRSRRDSYRRPDEPIPTLDYEVAPIDSDREARAFVESHHYSGSYPAARVRVGLYRGAVLVGVAVFSQPTNNAVITGLAPGLGHRDGMELGRFVLLDDVAGEHARARGGVARGRVGERDHGRDVAAPPQELEGPAEEPGLAVARDIGTIYQAHNAAYLGRSTTRTLRLLPDGTVFSDRAAQKVRARERGWVYAVDQLVAHGAPAPASDDLGAWLRSALALVTRTMRHPGNRRYAWALDRRLRRTFPAPDPRRYPKRRGVPA